MFAAARGAVLHAFAAPKFVELAPSPRNAETVGSASRDAKTVTMAHELARSFALWCPGSSATGVHLLATSRRDFVLTKAVDGVGAPIEAAGPRALAAKQRTARLGAKTHSRGPRCLRCRLGQPNDAHFKRQKLLKTLKNHIRQKCPFRSQWWIIRDRFNDLSWFSGGFYLDLVPSQLIFSARLPACTKLCTQPIILAYGSCASAKVCRHSVGVWLYAEGPGPIMLRIRRRSFEWESR